MDVDGAYDTLLDIFGPGGLPKEVGVLNELLDFEHIDGHTL